MYTEALVPLVCTYDSAADAASVHFTRPVPAGAVRQVVPFDPEHGMFNLDLDADGHVIGLEILDARRRLPAALLNTLLTHGRTAPE